MFPELSTERFLLGQVVPGDQAFLFEGLGDPAAMPYNGIYYDTLEATSGQLEWYDKNFREGTGTAWKITDKATGERIGVVSFYLLKPEHRKAEIGYWLLPRYWNRGIATEVLTAMIRYCQSEKKIHRLEAIVEMENAASSRVLEKLGFVYEGTMRDSEIKWGKFISLRLYALIAPYTDVLPR